MMITTATKELIVMSGAIKGAVDISQTSTLKDVRASILQEFDDDMLPCEDFCFYVNEIRISQKQEALKMAWDFVQEVPGIESYQRRTFCSPSSSSQETPPRERQFARRFARRSNFELNPTANIKQEVEKTSRSKHRMI
jgi:hypothetical protein